LSSGSPSASGCDLHIGHRQHGAKVADILMFQSYL